MELPEEQQPNVVDLVTGDADGAQSVMESLRRKRKDLANNREVDLVVPGYDQSPPVLFIRYGLLSGHEIEAITKKVFRETKDRWDRQLFSSIDAMVEALVGFYIDMEDGEEKRPLTLGGEPITTFGPELAELLDIEEVGSARKIVRELFGNNDVALAQHNVRISRWMSNTAADVDEELLGNA